MLSINKLLLYLSIAILPFISVVYSLQFTNYLPHPIINSIQSINNLFYQNYRYFSPTSTILSSRVEIPYPAYSIPKEINLLSITVEELNLYLNNGSSLNSVNLVLAYLHAIEKNNHQNLNLRAVIEVASLDSVLAQATLLDEERRTKGSRGGMHGIPILIKDNIATFDEFNTTAGSYALLGSKVRKDAFIISKLRKAGAIIIGKSSLSEWANYKGGIQNGWSARGGQTQSPYVIGGFAAGGDPCGSSSGSGVGVAAGFAPISIGTETDGSIICPGNRAALYAMKPTVGLTSRSGIIPISHSQDSPGPMTRSTWDTAMLLEIISGFDEDDSITEEASKHDTKSYLKSVPISAEEGFKELKIGIPRSHFYDPSKTNLSPYVYSEIESAFKRMSAHGANLVDPANLPSVKELWEISFSAKHKDSEEDLDRGDEGEENGVKGWERIVMDFEFKVDLAAYLRGLDWERGTKRIRSLADVIKFNDKNAELEMPEGQCCQEIFIDSVQTTGYDSPLYKKARSECIRIGETEGLQAVFDQYDLDVLAIPSEGRATTVAAITGWPIATVPIGYYGAGSGMEGQPFGLSFIARRFEEKKLIQVMGAFEQSAVEKRRVPSQLEV